ncbi:MAG: response regulator [bacterium]|nr:response regulator [bacterium]
MTMLAQRLLSSRRLDAPWLLLSFLVLLVCIHYSYLNTIRPNTGFELNTTTWDVFKVTGPCEDEAECLRLGDQVLEIDGVTYEQYRSERTVMPYRAFMSGDDTVSVKLRRDGEIRTIHLRAREGFRGRVTEILVAWFFPLLFWLMGTIAVVFLRPKDDRWLILILFCYATALWSASGFVSRTQMAYSAIVFHAVLGLFMPLSIHLHLILPDALFKKYHRWLLPPLYLASLGLIILDLLRPSSIGSFLWFAFAAIVVSLGLLVLRLFIPARPAIRMANRLMFFGVSLGLGPWVVLLATVFLAPSGGSLIYDIIEVVVFLVPIWPITYIYVLYKHDLEGVRFRANRLLGAYGFFSLYITLYVLIFALFVGRWSSAGQREVIFGLILSLIFVAIAPSLRHRFQLLVNRYVFGIRYRPDEVLSAFAERIPTAFSRQVLKGVIVGEILPTLLIRQSALYLFDDDEGDGATGTIYEQKLQAAVPREGGSDLSDLLGKAGRFLPVGTEKRHPYEWVRLVVPLSVQEGIIGVWLLGRRDPDDFYPQSDIGLLTNLANQIAAVIENLRLVEKAQREVAENKRLQERLVQSQKMEAIGRLSAGVAHDFNNLLSVILGYGQLLQAMYRTEEDLQRALSNLMTAGRQAADLTGQLLTFSRQQEMEIRVLDLNSVVSETVRMLRGMAGEGVKLVTKLSSELPLVMIDPGQMSQVIINLAVNAKDAMPDGGRLTIETTHVDCREAGPVPDANLPPGDYVLMRVQDTGTGIDPEVQARMFEPFCTTKEEGKGTGLGLSVVYGIISQCEGYIFADSTVGEGAIFSIYLPGVSEGQADDAEEEVYSTLSDRGSETILVAEDEDSLRSVTSEILTGKGYTVLEARSGGEALSVSEAHGGEIDLLLTDVVMPLMRGPALAERLLGSRPQLKVVYMSGFRGDAIRGRGLDKPGTVLIRKPFLPQTLARKVREVLDAGKQH